MAGQTHHIAQLNVGRLLEPLDSRRLAGFVAALDPINALADSSPGLTVSDDSPTGRDRTRSACAGEAVVVIVAMLVGRRGGREVIAT